MKAKNISINHALLLEYLIKKNKSFFTIDDVQEAMPKHSLKTKIMVSVSVSKIF